MRKGISIISFHSIHLSSNAFGSSPGGYCGGKTSASLLVNTLQYVYTHEPSHLISSNKLALTSNFSNYTFCFWPFHIPLTTMSMSTDADLAPILLGSLPTSTNNSLPDTKKSSDTDGAWVENGPEATEPLASPRSVKGILWALVVVAILSSTFLFALDNTVVADVQPTIVRQFGAVNKLTWLSVGYLLGSTTTNLLWYGLTFYHAHYF